MRCRENPRFRFRYLQNRSARYSLATVTIEELKAETAKLPPDDRCAFAEWIERNDDVRALRREELIREIRRGVEQADRGELIEADEVFARLRQSQVKAG